MFIGLKVAFDIVLRYIALVFLTAVEVPFNIESLQVAVIYDGVAKLAAVSAITDISQSGNLRLPLCSALLKVLPERILDYKNLVLVFQYASVVGA